MFDQKNECNQLSGSCGDTGATRKTGMLHQSRSQFIDLKDWNHCLLQYCCVLQNKNWGEKSKNCCIFIHYKVPEVLTTASGKLNKPFQKNCNCPVLN